MIMTIYYIIIFNFRDIVRGVGICLRDGAASFTAAIVARDRMGLKRVLMPQCSSSSLPRDRQTGRFGGIRIHYSLIKHGLVIYIYG